MNLNNNKNSLDIHVHVKCKTLCKGRPLAQSSHMVQNHTCWYTSWTVGLAKQKPVKVDWYELLSIGNPTVQLASMSKHDIV